MPIVTMQLTSGSGSSIVLPQDILLAEGDTIEWTPALLAPLQMWMGDEIEITRPNPTYLTLEEQLSFEIALRRSAHVRQVIRTE